MMHKIIFSLCVFASAWEAIQAACNGKNGLCGLKFNEVTFPGTHNSGAGYDGSYDLIADCSYRCQDKSYAQQLDDGIRFFDIDMCMGNDGKIYNCHNDRLKGSLEHGFTQMANKLNSMPNEVIAIRVSDIKGINDITEALAVFNTAFKGAGKPGLNVVPKSGGNYVWPTLQQAIDDGKRVFVFVYDSLCDSTCKSAYDWAISREIMKDTWQTRGVSTGCSGIVGDTETNCQTHASAELVLESHFGSYGLCVYNMAGYCQNYLQQSAMKCRAKRIASSKTVNFIAVDYYQYHHSGGQDNTGASCSWCGDVVEVASKLNDLNIASFG